MAQFKNLKELPPMYVSSASTFNELMGALFPKTNTPKKKATPKKNNKK